MNSPTPIVLLVAFLIAFGTLGSLWGWFDQAPIHLETSDPSEEKKSVLESGESFELDIEYPIFSGYPNDQLAALNEKMSSFIEDQKLIFLSETMVPLQPGFEKSSLTIRYAIHSLRPDLASISFVNTFYVSGAAHPGSYRLVFNYLPKSGIFIELPDILTGDYLESLSTVSRSVLREELSERGVVVQDSAWFQEGTEPRHENFQTFTISDTALNIYFDEYQVGPYALGSFEIPVTFDAIQGHIRTDAPFRIGNIE